MKLEKDEPPFIHELGFGVAPGRQTLVSTQEQRVKERKLEKQFNFDL